MEGGTQCNMIHKMGFSEKWMEDGKFVCPEIFFHWPPYKTVLFTPVPLPFPLSLETLRPNSL